MYLSECLSQKVELQKKWSGLQIDNFISQGK